MWKKQETIMRTRNAVDHHISNLGLWECMLQVVWTLFAWVISECPQCPAQHLTHDSHSLNTVVRIFDCFRQQCNYFLHVNGFFIYLDFFQITRSDNFIGSKGMNVFMVIKTSPTCFPNESYYLVLPPVITECTFQSISLS